MWAGVALERPVAVIIQTRDGQTFFFYKVNVFVFVDHIVSVAITQFSPWNAKVATDTM